jgi:hypothetical protein
METEAGFAVEGDEDAQWTATSSSARGGAVRVRHGSQSSQKVGGTVYNEETALLSQDVTRSQRLGVDLDSGDPTLHTPWLGAKEMQGKPWWRRPSVRPRCTSYPIVSSAYL